MGFLSLSRQLREFLSRQWRGEISATDLWQSVAQKSQKNPAKIIIKHFIVTIDQNTLSFTFNLAKTFPPQIFTDLKICAFIQKSVEVILSAKFLIHSHQILN